MASEKALQAYIQRKCKMHDMLVFKFASPARRGVPDLIVIPNGAPTFYIEVKSPTKRGILSDLQKYHIKLIRNQGANVYVIDDPAEADRIIEREFTGTNPERRD